MMLIAIFTVFLVVFLAEISGLMTSLSRCFSLFVVFGFIVYQYRKVGQLDEERVATEERLTRINKVIQTLLITTNINKLLSIIMDVLAKEKHFDSAFIYLVGVNNTLTCIAIRSAVALRGITRYSITAENQSGLIQQTIRSKTPLIVQNTKQNHLVDREIIDKLQLKQCVLLPLIVQDKIHGIIIVGNSKTEINITSQYMEILSAISNQVAVALQNAQLYSKIQELSVIDELTQLRNHRFFQQKIRDEIKLAKRYNSCLAFAMIDIDFFKNYNDRHGHLAGDACLKQIARVILQNVRETDTAVRYGGEEFALILPATDKHGAAKILEKLRFDVERFPFEFGHTQPQGKLTISAGVAVLPIDAKEPRELMMFADQSLYRAKEFGRNRVEIWGKEIH